MRELTVVVEGVVVKEDVNDKWVWKLDLSGFLSAKSAYRSLVVSHQNLSDGFLCRVWNKFIPLKIIEAFCKVQWIHVKVVHRVLSL